MLTLRIRCSPNKMTDSSRKTGLRYSGKMPHSSKAGFEDELRGTSTNRVNAHTRHVHPYAHIYDHDYVRNSKQINIYSGLPANHCAAHHGTCSHVHDHDANL